MTSWSNFRKRVYNVVFLDFGLTNLDGKPQCVICAATLSEESMKPNKLKCHLQSHHSEYAAKPRDFFIEKLEPLEKKKRCMKSFTTTNQSSVKASFVVALHIARKMKLHTIGEEF